MGMESAARPFKDQLREQRLFQSRVIACAVLVLALTAALVGRLVILQVVDTQHFSELSEGNRIKTAPLAPTRGLIFDRNGLLVAENLPTWQLVAVPEEIDDLDGVLIALEELDLLDSSNREELTELVGSRRAFERITLGNLSESQAARFAVRRHRFPGIDIQEGLIRHYPFADAVAHAVGYVGSISTADLDLIDRSEYAATSQIGKTGVERSYENILHGQVGYTQQEVNAQGRILLDPAAVDSAGGQRGLQTRWPTPGSHVVLSFDMRLQLAGHKAMENMRGAAVAIDPRNGDLLALISTPAFDPNLFAVGLSSAEFVALSTDPDNPLFNRALAGRYPPGSTIKPMLALAALQHESVNPVEDHFCGGFFTLPGSTHRYRDWRSQGHGPMDLHSAVVESCDVYFYRLAVGLGIDNMESFLKSFGFGSPTGLDIGGEVAGIVPSREWKRQRFTNREDQVWFPGETVIAGIGQGFTQVTPLQLAHASAALAASGRRFRPRLLIGTEDAVSGEFDPLEPVEVAAVPVDDQTHWQIVQDAMYGVMTELRGSGRASMLGASYTVAGKTGTAQVFTIPQGEEYDEESVDERLRDHGLFVAYAPAEAPQIAVAVVVENGGAGSLTAAPVARAILDAFFGTENYVTRHD
ncbi:penicillin-binding protein 2 [Candidatus Rariloculus sp.]|uniref:penicillin-binding protein 2 n=1 Tax=Candidatus Rariloculus sp. TaxID=3101265 RepID=UPI003D137C4A